MLITTSRKPGQKTRTFAKTVAEFMNWDYVSRGKASIKDFEGKTALAGEERGDPNSLKIYTPRKRYTLSFSVGEIKRLDVDQSPVIFVGVPPFNPTIMDAIPSGTRINFDSPKKVLVTSTSNGWILDFKYNSESIFKLKLFRVDEE